MDGFHVPRHACSTHWRIRPETRDRTEPNRSANSLDTFPSGGIHQPVPRCHRGLKLQANSVDGSPQRAGRRIFTELGTQSERRSMELLQQVENAHSQTRSNSIPVATRQGDVVLRWVVLLKWRGRGGGGRGTGVRDATEFDQAKKISWKNVRGGGSPTSLLLVW